jgi:hypothetical protein
VCGEGGSGGAAAIRLHAMEALERRSKMHRLRHSAAACVLSCGIFLNREEELRVCSPPMFLCCLALSAVVVVLAMQAAPAHGADLLRLAQTSAVTTCMMSCNSQAASCQTACVVPGTPPTGAATTTSNATASQSCLSTCSSQQLACQTTCARTSPSE